MTPLPGALGDGSVVAWRLDYLQHAATWDSGEGAFLAGGRWNSPGRRAVYCCLDPAAAILEVAVHKGFPALDLVPHVLTRGTLRATAQLRIVRAEDVPNPNWLRPGTPSAGQRAFGDEMLRSHDGFLVPSVVSPNSWNLVLAAPAGTWLEDVRHERFALDTRLNPPADR